MPFWTLWNMETLMVHACNAWIFPSGACLTAWLAVWVLEVALDAVLRAVAADGVGGCDMATSVGVLGCVNRVWGLSWGRQGGVGGGMVFRSWWGCWGGSR
jgi:hypothetical protein